MFRFIVLIVLLSPLMLLNQGCSRKLALESSRYQDQPLVIDGAGDDWTKLPRFYDAETKLSYDVSNDDKNLYVILKAVDNDLKSKILRGGFNIWLDTTWSKKQDRGLRYPLPASERTVQYGDKDPNSKNQQDTKEMHMKFSRNLQEMDLVGIAAGKSARTTSQNAFGIIVSLSLDKEGTLFYEAAIPLNQIFKDSVTMPLVKRKVAVGLMSNKPEAKPSTTPTDHNDGNDEFGKHGTGGVGGGDMMRGRNGSGGYGGQSSMPHNRNFGPEEKQVNLWMTVQLVSKI